MSPIVVLSLFYFVFYIYPSVSLFSIRLSFSSGCDNVFSLPTMSGVSTYIPFRPPVVDRSTRYRDIVDILILLSSATPLISFVSFLFLLFHVPPAVSFTSSFYQSINLSSSLPGRFFILPLLVDRTCSFAHHLTLASFIVIRDHISLFLFHPASCANPVIISSPFLLVFFYRFYYSASLPRFSLLSTSSCVSRVFSVFIISSFSSI